MCVRERERGRERIYSRAVVMIHGKSFLILALRSPVS